MRQSAARTTAAVGGGGGGGMVRPLPVFLQGR